MDSHPVKPAESQQQGQVDESPPSVSADDALQSPSAKSSPAEAVAAVREADDRHQQPPTAAVSDQQPSVVSDCAPSLDLQTDVERSTDADINIHEQLPPTEVAISADESLPPSSDHVEVVQSAADDVNSAAVPLESEKPVEDAVPPTEIATNADESLPPSTTTVASSAEDNVTSSASAPSTEVAISADESLPPSSDHVEVVQSAADDVNSAAVPLESEKPVEDAVPPTEIATNADESLPPSTTTVASSAEDNVTSSASAPSTEVAISADESLPPSSDHVEVVQSAADDVNSAAVPLESEKPVEDAVPPTEIATNADESLPPSSDHVEVVQSAADDVNSAAVPLESEKPVEDAVPPTEIATNADESLPPSTTTVASSAEDNVTSSASAPSTEVAISADESLPPSSDHVEVVQSAADDVNSAAVPLESEKPVEDAVPPTEIATNADESLPPSTTTVASSAEDNVTSSASAPSTEVAISADESLPPSSDHVEVVQSAADDVNSAAVPLESEKPVEDAVPPTEIATNADESLPPSTTTVASSAEDNVTSSASAPSTEIATNADESLPPSATTVAGTAEDNFTSSVSADVEIRAEVSLGQDDEQSYLKSPAVAVAAETISLESSEKSQLEEVALPTQPTMDETQVLPVQVTDLEQVTLDQTSAVSENDVVRAQNVADTEAVQRPLDENNVRLAVDEAPLVAAAKPSSTQAWIEQKLPTSGDDAWAIVDRPPAPQQCNSMVEEMEIDASSCQNLEAESLQSGKSVTSEADAETRTRVDEESVVVVQRAPVKLAVDLHALELEDGKQTKEDIADTAAILPHQNIPDVLPSALEDSRPLSDVDVATAAEVLDLKTPSASEAQVSTARSEDVAPPVVLSETVPLATTSIVPTPVEQVDSKADSSMAADCAISGKQSPTDRQKTKESSASPTAGRSGGVLGFFQRKSKPSEQESVHNTPESDRRKKSGSLDRKVVGEDIIRQPQPEPASVVATTENGHSATAAAGFHLRFGIGKDKTEVGGQVDSSPQEENTLNGSGTPLKKPQRPSSAVDQKSPASVKSPTSKTNLRIFEIMASSSGGGNGSKNLSDNNGEVESPRLKSNATAAETSVFCPVGPPVVPPLSPSPDDYVDGYRVRLSSQPTGGMAMPSSTAGVKLRHPVASPDAEHQDNVTSSKYMVTVAIDFGTAFSGYAFCFTSEMTSERGSSIHMMGKWEGGDPGLVNQKTPSSLLLTADGQFHSFGFTARNFYHDLNPDDADRWLYFDKFKMALYNSPECNTNTVVEAANGQKLPVLTVVAMTLRFFRDHAIKELAEQCGTTISNDDIRWIVTVPAIWNSQAKQFMRLAAYEAGLATPGDSDQLLIALEPEAASIHIRRLRMHQLVPEKPIKRPLSVRQPDANEAPTDLQRVSSKFNNRSIRYMVVDCGGGTVDITVHELDTITGRLQELHKAAGGPHGSCGIDAEFAKLLDKIFGADMVQSFRHKRPSGWVDLMTAFEARKRAADPTKTNSLNVALPFCFIDYYRKYSRGSTVEVAINKFADKEIRWSSQGMLRMTQEAMKKLFQPTLDSISETVASVLEHPSLHDVQFIFLVGGLSESPVVQRHMRERFGSTRDMQVLVPQEASLAVLKGAVCFGLDQTVVAVRRSRMTYGAAVLKRFARGQHPESKLLKRSGTEWCRDIFDPYVVVDQVVHYGEVVTRRYAPASSSQTYISIAIFSSDQSSPKFTTDVGVSRCATLRLDLPSINQSQQETTTKSQSSTSLRVIEARMTFAETEIKVTAVDIATGQSVNASIDFFNV